MPNTPRMGIPYPNKNETDWYNAFQSALLAIDSHMFAHREDRNLIMYSDATFTWDAATSTLSWTDPFYLVGAQSGGRWKVDADSIVINDGEMFVVGIARWPQGTVTLQTLESRSACEQTDEGCVVCVRSGSNLYFRTGVKMEDGDSFDIFLMGGGGGAGDVEKHQRHMHTNGIVRSTTATGALAVSVTDGGGAVDDTLDVAAVPGGDSYYVNGRERTQPAAVFSFTNPALGANDVKLYRAYMADAGDPQFQQRVTYSQPAAIGRFWIVQCSRSILAGGGSIEFRTVVAANFWQVRFGGGPALLVPTAGLPEGIYRLYAADGVNWIDVYFPMPGALPGQFDWTLIDAVTPLAVALTFLPEIDEKAYFVIGTAVAWMDGGFVQWGYGASSGVLNERRWGNVGESIIGDDFLHYIAERVGTVSTSGVIFDHDAAWSERMGVGPLPMSEFNEVNFGLKYDNIGGNLTISGGKLLVDGQIYVRGGQNFPLALALAGVDYYLWWDLSDETMKITDAASFPTMWDGTSNPLAWIMGGSTFQDRHLTGQLDKPTRGVPLYVFQRGIGPATIDEATLCDLRRNVTKASMKNHLTVGGRTDWTTPNFVPFASIPLLNETEAEFGCLDAAFRYINAIPHEFGNDVIGGPSLIKRWGRNVEVVGFVEDRHWLQLPPDTNIIGSGYAVVAFHQNATPNTSTFPLAPLYPPMLLVGNSSSIKDVMVFAHGGTSSRAAVGMIGAVSGSQFAGLAKTVLENAILYSSGGCGVVTKGSFALFNPEVVIDRCLILGVDEFSWGVASYGIFSGDDMDNTTVTDTIMLCQDAGIFVTDTASKVIVDRSLVFATSMIGGPGISYPDGYGIYARLVAGVEIHQSQVWTIHSRAIRLGSGTGLDMLAIVDSCIVSGDNISGTATALKTFVDIRASQSAIQDCFIHGPTAGLTESGLKLVRMQSTGPLQYSRNYAQVRGSSLAWNYGVEFAGTPVVGCIANLLYGPSYNPIDGGIPIGVRVSGAQAFKCEGMLVSGFSGIGIDVVNTVPDVVISKCSVNGGQWGNGIRAGRAIIEGNFITLCLSWGIHCYPNSMVKNNRIWQIAYQDARVEGPLVFGEDGAWGIRYGSDGPGSFDIRSLHIEDNEIDSVETRIDKPANGRGIVCGIGPEYGPAPDPRYMVDCQIDRNEIHRIFPDNVLCTNMDFAGIALRHPARAVSADENDIWEVGVESLAQWSYGIACYQGTDFTLPMYIEAVSIDENKIRSVLGSMMAVGIYSSGGSKVSVSRNKVYGVYADEATVILAAHVMLMNNSGLGIAQDRIRIDGNEIGSGGSIVAPVGYGVLSGIYVQQTDSSFNDIYIAGNQCDGDLSGNPALLSGFISIIADGSNFTVSHNQHSILTMVPPVFGIYVWAPSGKLKNVIIDGNESYGEYRAWPGFRSASIEVDSVKGVDVSDNMQTGFGGIGALTSGIKLNACSNIDVHDNEILDCWPDPAQGDALIRIIDCVFGSVHDNVLNGTIGIGNIDSLRFDDTGPGNCLDLHIHDNKIAPRGVLLGPYDIGFYGAGPGSFGTDMTIWANVFGSTATPGIENFVGSAWYVAMPMPGILTGNNWSGAAFV